MTPSAHRETTTPEGPPEPPSPAAVRADDARADDARSGRSVRTAAQSRSCGEGRFPLACAFRCAAEGVRYAFTSQRNLKIQSALGLAAVALGLILGLSQAEWLALVLCIMVVAMAEIINTAIESVVDLATSHWHPLARAAKDAAAGAVLVASAGSVVIGLIVFLPHIIALF